MYGSQSGYSTGFSEGDGPNDENRSPRRPENENDKVREFLIFPHSPDRDASKHHFTSLLQSKGFIKLLGQGYFSDEGFEGRILSWDLWNRGSRKPPSMYTSGNGYTKWWCSSWVLGEGGQFPWQKPIEPKRASIRTHLDLSCITWYYDVSQQSETSLVCLVRSRKMLYMGSWVSYLANIQKYQPIQASIGDLIHQLLQ